MNVTLIGTGYVGLVTGACVADAGNAGLGFDVDAKKIAMLNEGRIPIFEPGLEAVVRRNREAGRLRFSTDEAASVAHAELQMIAVGTPPGEDGSADLQHVIAAARAIGRHMQGWKLVATKSTVPVGTADKIKAAISEQPQNRTDQALNALHTKRQNLYQELAVVILLLLEPNIRGLEKRSNATSLNSR